MLPYMHIDIVSDTICPWCFVGKRRFERALKARPDLEIEIEWRAFELNPDMAAEGMDRHSYLVQKFGGEGPAQDIYDRITLAGEGEDIAFAFDRMARVPNTVNSHRLILWAGSKGVQDAVVEGLFRRYFSEAQDIGQLDILVETAVDAGLDEAEARRHLESDDGADQVRAEVEAARRMGIHGVPCFIIDRKFSISGAQEPEAFFRAFDAARKEAATAG